MNRWVEETLLDRPIGSEVPLDEPPCRRCQFWRPAIVADDCHPREGALRCCHSPEGMFRDFSCFEARQ